MPRTVSEQARRSVVTTVSPPRAGPTGPATVPVRPAPTSRRWTTSTRRWWTGLVARGVHSGRFPTAHRPLPQPSWRSEPRRMTRVGSTTCSASPIGSSIRRSDDLGGHLAHPLGLVGDHAHAEEPGELEVVESEQADLGARAAGCPAGRRSWPGCCRRTPRSAPRRNPGAPTRRLRRRRCPGPSVRMRAGSTATPARLEGVAVAEQPLVVGVERVGAPHERHPGVPGVQEREHPGPGAGAVVQDDAVAGGVRQGPVDGHDRRAEVPLAVQVAVVVGDRDEQQPADPPLEHRRDHGGLQAGLVVRGGDDQGHALPGQDALHAGGDQRVERVGQVPDHEAHGVASRHRCAARGPGRWDGTAGWRPPARRGRGSRGRHWPRRTGPGTPSWCSPRRASRHRRASPGPSGRCAPAHPHVHRCHEMTVARRTAGRAIARRRSRGRPLRYQLVTIGA